MSSPSLGTYLRPVWLDAVRPFRVHQRVRFGADRKGCYPEIPLPAPRPTQFIVTMGWRRIYGRGERRNVKCAMLEWPSRFVCDTSRPTRRISMEDLQKQAKQQAIVMAAAIFAARSLSDWDGGRSPRAIAAASDAISKAKFLVEEIERKLR